MARRRLTPEAAQAAHERREQRLGELHAQLTAGIERLTSSEEWTAWLRVASHFHSYSFNNTMLIHTQRPDATRVAGYKVWRQLGRQVEKGEHGIQILAPVVRRSGTGRDEAPDQASAIDEANEPVDESRGEDRSGKASSDGTHLVGFRVAHVFDVSQTSGDPLPEPERPQLVVGEAPSGLWDQLAAQVGEQGFEVRRGPCGGQRNGYTDFLDRIVVVRDSVDDAQAVKTLAHELGHVLMHGPDQLAARDTRVCRGSAEVEAESVAYLVVSTHGLDVSGYTFPYVAHWATTAGGAGTEQVADIVQRSAVHVLGIARRVLAATEQAERPAREMEHTVHRTEVGRARTAALQVRAEALADPAAHQPTGAAAARDVDRILTVNAAAAAWWSEQLHRPEHAGPRRYLVERGVRHVFAPHSPWHVGYADGRWTSLIDQLRSAGFTSKELLASGLAMTSRKGNVIDRFRDRIMLPIRRIDGGIVGFIGRAAPGAPPEVPKYLNTASTAAFSKGEVLFGLAEQTETIRHGRTLIVEGPFDVLAVAGLRANRAAVGPCGTALTDRQVAILAEYAPRVAVAFDADPAGMDATVRVHELLRSSYTDPEWVQLPEGADPAALAAAGNDHLAAALDQPFRPLADAVVDHAIAAHDLTEAQQLVVANRHAAHVIARLPADQVARQVTRVANELDIDVTTVTETVTEAFTHMHNPPRRHHGHHRRGDATTRRMTAVDRAVAHLPRVATNDHRRSDAALSLRLPMCSPGFVPPASSSARRRSSGTEPG